MSNIIETTKVKFDEIVQAEGYELYDVELSHEGENTFLRVYIESLNNEGIMIEDCLKVNSALNKYLDQEDPINGAYMLEVSSPGVIRKLKTQSHYERQIGKEIAIKLKTKLEGFDSKSISAELQAVNEDGIVVDEKEIRYEDIHKAETTFKF